MRIEISKQIKINDKKTLNKGEKYSVLGVSFDNKNNSYVVMIDNENIKIPTSDCDVISR